MICPWTWNPCFISDLIDDLERYECWIFGGLALVAVIAFIWHAGKLRRPKV